MEKDPFFIVREIIDHYGKDRTKLILALHEIVKNLGYVSQPLVGLLAEGFQVSKAEVNGLVTFYPRFRLRSKTRILIECCAGLSCEACNAGRVLSAVKRFLKIKENESSRDGVFYLQTHQCLGRCEKGPAIALNGVVHEKVTPELAIGIIEEALSAQRGSQKRGI